MAMAQARLGRTAEARRSLARAEQKTRSALAGAPVPPQPLDLEVQVCLPLLLREAERTVGQG